MKSDQTKTLHKQAQVYAGIPAATCFHPFRLMMLKYSLQSVAASHDSESCASTDDNSAS